MVDGTMSTSIEQAAQRFVQLFTDLLGLAQPVQAINTEVLNIGPLISAQHADLLTVPILEADIKTALHSIGKDKSPSPDGYTSQFFVSTWEVVRLDLVSAV